MREIKFRAWDKKRKRMYEVLSLHRNDFEGHWATVKGYDCIEQKDIHIQIQPKHIELMQYTGLRDKNGVEIYDGDIIEWGTEGYKTKVYWEHGSWCTDHNRLSHYLATGDGWVIGNIYEHPHLLEDKA